MSDAPVYFLVLAAVGVLAAVFMAGQARARGRRVIVMAAAFVCFSLANLAVYLDWPSWTIWLIGSVLVVLLLADIVLRALAGKK